MRQMFAVKLFTVQKFLLVLLCLVNLIYGQYPHRAVLENEAQEAYLPPQYRSVYYHSPHVRQALEWSSWFHPGEFPVEEREADKIPRYAIYRVLHHAGFLQRQRPYFYR